MAQITKDAAYDAADPRDFPAMLEVERYGRRSTAFDKIISATHDHFWDPLDRKYIDFGQPFDLDAEMALPDDFFVIFRTGSAIGCRANRRSNSRRRRRAGSSPRSCTASRGRSRCRLRSATS